MTAHRVALIDWDEAHVDVPDLDLVLPVGTGGFDNDVHEFAEQTSAAKEAAVCWVLTLGFNYFASDCKVTALQALGRKLILEATDFIQHQVDRVIECYPTRIHRFELSPMLYELHLHLLRVANGFVFFYMYTLCTKSQKMQILQ